MLEFTQIAIGFFLLFAGSEFLVRGSVSLAIAFGISRLVVGLTIIAFATSSPELFVGVQAALDSKPDLVLGNMIGSNICNICLILGVAALVNPLEISAETIRQEAPILAGATLITFSTMLGGAIHKAEGIFLVCLFVVYNIYLINSARKASHTPPDYVDDTLFTQPRKRGLSICMVALGIILLMVGAEFLIRGAVETARRFDISEAIVGLTLLAIGTSLPELAAAITASRKGESDLVVGNVIGSNLFNILCVLGLAAILAPIPTAGMPWVNTAIFCGTSVLLVPIMKTHSKINRREGVFLLLIYGGYLAYLVQT